VPQQVLVVHPSLGRSAHHLIHIPGNPSRSWFAHLPVQNLADSVVAEADGPIPLLVAPVVTVAGSAWPVVRTLQVALAVQ
jgi:hypothetical protein